MLMPQGIDPIGGTRADFIKFLAAEKARLALIVRAADMKNDKARPYTSNRRRHTCTRNG